MRRILALLAGAIAVAATACNGSAGAEVVSTPAPGFGGTIIPVDHPEPNEPPSVSIVVPGAVHAGIAAGFQVLGRDPDDIDLTGSLSFGDGTPPRLFGRGTLGAAQQYTYARPGTYSIVAILKDPRGGIGQAETQLEVHPRKVLFVQGYGSQSGCPGGAGFANRLVDWVPALLAGARVDVAGPADLLYASYSGRWCDGGDGSNGAYADYSGGETCGGIDDPGGIAGRLREQIDAVAPARVTIVGHSMGGLAAAWLVGSDPVWARRHIASVVTFDSPLGGVPQVNLSLLRIGGECSFNSKSIDDLSDANRSIVETAAAAAGIVPFYNLDATNLEGVFILDLRQPVPGDRTHLAGEALHWELPTTHNGIWNSAPGDEALGPLVRAAVACAIELVPAWACRVD